MRFIKKILKRVCVALLSLYSFNIMFEALNIFIPINISTLIISSLLGVSGIVSLIVLYLVI